MIFWTTPTKETSNASPCHHRPRGHPAAACRAEQEPDGDAVPSRGGDGQRPDGEPRAHRLRTAGKRADRLDLSPAAALLPACGAAPRLGGADPRRPARPARRRGWRGWQLDAGAGPDAVVDRHPRGELPRARHRHPPLPGALRLDAAAAPRQQPYPGTARAHRAIPRAFPGLERAAAPRRPRVHRRRVAEIPQR